MNDWPIKMIKIFYHPRAIVVRVPFSTLVLADLAPWSCNDNLARSL